jgi:hypothetical protein
MGSNYLISKCKSKICAVSFCERGNGKKILDHLIIEATLLCQGPTLLKA